MLNLKKELRNMKVKFLDLKVSIQNKSKLNKALDKVLSSGNFILGEEVVKFEKIFSQYLGTKYCIGMGNGLEAIQISLMALNIGQGDEVITTPISAIATTLAILAVGARPTFVDTGSDGLINPDLIPQAITKKTKAIIPVHLYGNPVALDKILDICKKYKLFLIEDAAQAHGSNFKGKKLGSFGNVGCFSFYPTKNLGALGDGGAIVTSSTKLAKLCAQIRDYGQKSKYLHIRYGLNSRLDELQAALLNTKLQNLDIENNKRKLLAKKYIKNLGNIQGLEIIKPRDIKNANFHLFVIKTKKRNKLKKYLEKIGIQTLIHYPKIIPDQPFLKKEYGQAKLPIAREFVKSCLSLPCHPNISLSDIYYISSNIKGFFGNQAPNKI